MGDHDDGLFTREIVNGIHDQFLGDSVQGACGLIENKHVRVMIKGSSDADTLPLATGQLNTSLADPRRQSVGQITQKIIQMRHGSGSPHLGLVDQGLRQTKGDVLPDAAVGEENRLRHEANTVLPLAQVIGRQGLAVDAHLALLRLDQAEKDINGGRLAGPARSHQADGAIGRNHQVQFTQSRLTLTGITEHYLG